jgi:predicted permease
MDGFLIDIRHSLRSLRRSRGLLAGATLALALGIGATTTLFSLVHGALADLPFAEPDELVVLTRTLPRSDADDLGARPFDYLAWSAQQRSFEALAAFSSVAINLGDRGLRPQRVSGAWVTPSAFALLGATPAIGRGFREDDAGPAAAPVVMIGHDLWQGRYGADPDVVGREIRVNGEVRTLVGVMPAGFGFPVNESVWLPLATDGAPPPEQGRWLQVFGRLRDGVSPDAARTEMAIIADRLAQAQPATHADYGIRVMPFAHSEMDPNTDRILYLMLLAASFVLVIACANVANLLLARAATRTSEVAVRVSLGASRRRIVVQHLYESMAIALLGGAGGLLIAWAGVRFFDAATADIIEAFWIDFRVDRVVFGFATALVALAGVLAGILPALRTSRLSAAAVLKSEAGGATALRIGRLSRGLVIGELAFACGLLTVSGIFVKAAVGLRAIALPFPAREMLTAQLAVMENHIGEPAARTRFVRDLDDRLRATPGIPAVALFSTLPGRGAGSWAFRLDQPLIAAPVPEESRFTGVVHVTPGFLEVLGARPLRGRDLAWSDDADAEPVALVNETWVRRFSSDRDPVGRSLTLFDAGRFTIVGVVPDLQVQDPEDGAAQGVYLSMLQSRPWGVRILARTAGDPLALASAVRGRVEAVDPDLPVFEIATLHDAIYADKRVLDAFGTLFGVFGAGALFLTVVGLYGVVSFGVTQRTREVGVRMALGADRREIAALVLRQGLRPLAIGGGIGLLLALGLARGIGSAIDFIDALDPLVFAGVFGALGLTAVSALLLPARRASAIEPLRALRHE